MQKLLFFDVHRARARVPDDGFPPPLSPPLYTTPHAHFTTVYCVCRPSSRLDPPPLLLGR